MKEFPHEHLHSGYRDVLFLTVGIGFITFACDPNEIFHKSTSQLTPLLVQYDEALRQLCLKDAFVEKFKYPNKGLEKGVKCSFADLNDGRFGPLLTNGTVLEVGVTRAARGLERPLSVTTGGSGGSNAADNLLAAHEGKALATSSDGHLLSKTDSTFRKKKNHFSPGCLTIAT